MMVFIINFTRRKISPVPADTYKKYKPTWHFATRRCLINSPKPTVVTTLPNLPNLAIRSSGRPHDIYSPHRPLVFPCGGDDV